MIQRNDLARVILAWAAMAWALQVSPCFSEDNRESQQELGKWVMTYYQNPQPEQFVDKVKTMSKFGLLHDSRPGARPDANVMFLGKIMASNPGEISDWMSSLAMLPEREFKSVKRAVWYSGTPEGMTWLRENGEAELADGPRPVLLSGQRAMQMQPHHLDQLWEWFFATGDAEPVNRIVSLFSLAHEKPNQEGLALLGPPKDSGDKIQFQIQVNNYRLLKPALWSTTSLAIEQDRVLEILEESKQKHYHPGIQAWVTQVIKIAKSQRAAKNKASTDR